MKRFALLILILVPFIAHAQYNVKTTSFQINDFRADSMKMGPVINITDNENVEVLVKVDDTSTVRFASDSVVFAYAYQRGRITTNASGYKDTSWDRPSRFIDSVNFAGSGNFKADGALILGDTLLDRALDSSYVTGFVCSEKVFTPYWSPIARIWFKGGTGNNKDAFLSLQVDVNQRKYTRVDVGTGRQPE